MRHLLALTFLVLGISCNKSKEELRILPAKTQSGANTVGFRLNDDVWTLNGKYCYNAFVCRENPKAQYFSNFNGVLMLTADKVIYKGTLTSSAESLELSIRKNFNRTGLYQLQGIDSLFEATFTNLKNYEYYKLYPNRSTFNVTITRLDTAAKIVSGEFSGWLFKSDNLADSIIIKEGRFDVMLQQ